ncbi:unnamed protein product, partial [Meganyctiphanes norvegica]
VSSGPCPVPYAAVHLSIANMSKPEISAKDQDRVKFAFDVYDFEGKGTVDAYYIKDLLRAVNLNPTNKKLEAFDVPAKKGERTIKLDEVFPMFATIKKDKDCGSYDDFVEVLKLYDKEENGTMMSNELEYILMNLGEMLSKDDTKLVMGECCPPEDEDGCFEIIPFLKKLCEKE